MARTKKASGTKQEDPRAELEGTIQGNLGTAMKKAGADNDLRIGLFATAVAATELLAELQAETEHSRKIAQNKLEEADRLGDRAKSIRTEAEKLEGKLDEALEALLNDPFASQAVQAKARELAKAAREAIAGGIGEADILDVGRLELRDDPGVVVLREERKAKKEAKVVVRKAKKAQEDDFAGLLNKIRVTHPNLAETAMEALRNGEDIVSIAQKSPVQAAVFLAAAESKASVAAAREAMHIT